MARLNPDDQEKEVTGLVVNAASGAMRTCFNTPSLYRLAKKRDGSLVLQGFFPWTEHNTLTGKPVRGGGDWKTIPIHTLTPAEETQEHPPGD